MAPSDPVPADGDTPHDPAPGASSALGQARKVTEPPFIWPLRQANGWDHERAWATVGFVDHDQRSPGFLVDYHGGERTYDPARVHGISFRFAMGQAG